MSCNSCAKPYSLLRKEKGCPSCGFSFCSNCLSEKIFLPKLNIETKVCAKCKRDRNLESNEKNKIAPPDVYYKRLGSQDTYNKQSGSSGVTAAAYAGTSTADDEIQKRLCKLREDRKLAGSLVSEDELAQRLNKLKGELSQTSDAELQERLARLKGVPIISVRSKKEMIGKRMRHIQPHA